MELAKIAHLLKIIQLSKHQQVSICVMYVKYIYALIALKSSIQEILNNYLLYIFSKLIFDFELHLILFFLII